MNCEITKLWQDCEADVNSSFMDTSIWKQEAVLYGQGCVWICIFQQVRFGLLHIIFLDFFSWGNDSSVPLKSWKSNQTDFNGTQWKTSAHLTIYVNSVLLSLDHPLHLISRAGLCWPTCFLLSPTRNFIILSQQQCQQPRLNGLFQAPHRLKLCRPDGWYHPD